MSAEHDDDSVVRLPADEGEAIPMAGAGTHEEKNLAVAQARLIGDLD